MALVNYCEFMKGTDYRNAFDALKQKIGAQFNGNVAGTVASTTLVEHPIHIADTWDEVSAFNEAYGFMERDSYGEPERTTVLDCGATGNGDEHMWIFYGQSEL